MIGERLECPVRVYYHIELYMAAQYDVNLEKCALLKCLCGEWKRVCCRTGSGALTCWKRVLFFHSPNLYFLSFLTLKPATFGLQI